MQYFHAMSVLTSFFFILLCSEPYSKGRPQYDEQGSSSVFKRLGGNKSSGTKSGVFNRLSGGGGKSWHKVTVSVFLPDYNHDLNCLNFSIVMCNNCQMFFIMCKGIKILKIFFVA